MSLRQQLADSAANIEWRSDDGSALVSIPVGVVDRIAGHITEAYKSIPRRGAEAGGLLIGGVRLGTVTEIFITGFEPVACDYLYGPSFILSDASQAEFRAAMTRHPAGEILGYYRSHTRTGFGVEASDRELVARVFPGLAGLILLIKPLSVMSLAGNYFFFERGSLEMRAVGREFPFTGTTPGGAPLSRPEREMVRPAKTDPPKPIQASLELAPPSSDKKDESPPSVEEFAPVEPPEAKQRRSLQWEIVAAGLMIAAALALLWWQYRGDNGDNSAQGSHATASRVASLGLAVQPGEGGWRITWNPKSPAARDALRGVLNVAEVDSQERIPLDVQQIHDGAATYRPVGDDIEFRLELVRPDNTLATETYRVVMKPEETASAKPPSVKPPAVKPVPPRAPKAVEKPATTPQSPPTEGYVEPEVLSRVAPQVPEGIRPRITSPQPIDVRVSIDRAGRVTSATPLQHGEGLINYLADRAITAAKQWTFTPAMQNGKPVASTRTIHFVFEQ